ncbi:MAG: LemA family protein [Alphaproteobacteria bacterium]|nr:LemA family protein [Alphaproteobacteria bacterium]
MSAVIAMPRRHVRAFAAIMLALLLGGCGINDIPRLDEAVKAAWAQVQNQYQRRADLVPNLVETVKGYAAHERETLEAVVNARAKATQITVTAETLANPEAFKQFQQSQQALSGALGRLLAVAENYPQLKADAQFQQLMVQLEGTENRISVARRDYIQAVQNYNTEIRTFPGVIWASTLYRDAKPKESFTAEAGADRAPRVNFNKGS